MTISTVRKFGVGIASAAMVLGLCAPAMADEEVKPAQSNGEKILLPGGQTFERLSGMDRVETALAIAVKQSAVADAKGEDYSLKTAYLVNSNAFVDAATAGMLTDGVVLLVPSGRGDQLVLGTQIMEKLPNVTKLVAIGGEKVVSDDAIANVKKLNKNIASTSRIGGMNRYETNIAIAKKAFPTGEAAEKTAYITRGDMIVDALTAGAITNGPVVLVNHEGTVDPATVKYFKAFEAMSHRSVILGGPSAVPASQVAQLMDVKKQVDPWKFTATEADLKKSLQKAAAEYFGQGQWQHMAAEEATYFGLDDKAKKVVAGTNVDSAKIDISKAITDAKDAFIGYLPSYQNLKANRDAINTKVVGLQATLDEAVAAAVAGNKTAKDLSGADSDTIATDYKALYGADLTKPVMDGDSVADAGSFTFDSTTGYVTGLNTAAIEKMVMKDMASTDKVATISGESYTLKELVMRDDAAGKTTTGDIDWAAALKLATDKTAEQLKVVEAKKKVLDDAMAAYKAGPAAKVLVVSEGGIPRLEGANRYETAALLSYFLTQGSQGYAAQIDPATKVFIASGDDAHLADSVVAGQLTGGPILLVPSAGEINANTASELKRLASQKTIQAGYILGGPMAVSASTMKAAADAFSKGGEFVAAK